ncbi:MAG: hypothetical protein UZ03_NOB001002781 [Nitrospira sp. OLB3]|nr:MAG: hypothetical protein UZ03_NOB001002781 [Nitrospira sp. OLB3]
MGNGSPSSPHPEHQTFKQGIAGQTIGPMDSATGHLSRGIQSRQRGGAVHIGPDAPHHVMCAGRNRNPLLGHIDVVPKTGGIDGRKPPLHEGRPQMRHVQIHVARPRGRHLRPDGPRHDIPRRQRPVRMIPVHEQLALDVAQSAAFPPDGFREQKRRTGRQVERRGVELHELHVREHRPGSKRHRHAVAGGIAGIGGPRINLPGPSGGQHDRTGRQEGTFSCQFVQHDGPATAPSNTSRSTVNRRSSRWMRRCRAAWAMSARTISLPVASPRARRMRLRL